LILPKIAAISHSGFSADIMRRNRCIRLSSSGSGTLLCMQENIA